MSIRPLQLAASLVGVGLALACTRPAPPSTPAECRAQGLADLGRRFELRFATVGAWQPCRHPVVLDEALGPLCPDRHLSAEPVSPLPDNCDPAVRDHVKAVRWLAFEPAKTDEAIDVLESLTRQDPTDPIPWNDLAVGYALRAARQDRAADLLHADQALEQALTGRAPLAASRFNRALVRTTILPPSLAEKSWDAVSAAEPDAAWRAEADERRAELAAQIDRDLATSWPLTRERLLTAAAAQDREALGNLARLYPLRTLSLVVGELLPGWAEAVKRGDRQAADAELAIARRVAEAIAAATGDPLALETVAHVESALSPGEGSPRVADLVAGLASFGRKASAHRFLVRAQSPLAPLAEQIAIAERSRNSGCADDLAQLESLEQAAESRGHRFLAFYLAAQRGHCSPIEVEQWQAYEDALDHLAKIQDFDATASGISRSAQLSLALGEPDSAWERLSSSLRGWDRISSLEERSQLLGSAQYIAGDLGASALAFVFAEARVRVLEDALRAGESSPLLLRHRLQALVNLAEISARLNRIDQATASLARATSLGATSEFPSTLRPRLLQAEAELVAPNDRARAVELLGEALAATDPTAPAFVVARLHFQRAKWLRDLEDFPGAEADLARGLAKIEDEELRNLGTDGAALADPYFGRFSDAVEELVGLLLDDHRGGETFARVERARGFEPLQRVRELPFAPLDFTRLTDGTSPIDPAGIQPFLPPGTALLSYSVLPDRLLVWVLTGEKAFFQVAPVSRREIIGWVREIRRQVRARPDAESAARLNSALERPFAALVGKPLAQLGPAAIDRLVVIPDEELHGLPFAALWNTARQRYLIEDYALSVAPSALLYRYSLARDQALGKPPVPHALLVGDPSFDRSLPFARNLSALTEAVAEVQAIAPLYPSSVSFVNDQATIAHWLTELPAAHVVHYAGHAIANLKHPERSLLLLAPGATGDHGVLEACNEQMPKQLPHTRLVVLAACSTAGGQPIGALGLAPLVRPFSRAGVPGVVGTLWDVDSAAAQRLSQSFHCHYAAGLNADFALRRAQLEMLSAASSPAPVQAWAAYQLVGFASSPFQSEANRFREGESPCSR